MTAMEWSDLYAQTQQDRLGRLEVVVKALGDFVRAHDAWVLAQDGSVDELAWIEINAELDRQYELLDSLGEDRP